MASLPPPSKRDRRLGELVIALVLVMLFAILLFP